MASEDIYHERDTLQRFVAVVTSDGALLKKIPEEEQQLLSAALPPKPAASGEPRPGAEPSATGGKAGYAAPAPGVGAWYQVIAVHACRGRWYPVQRYAPRY